MSANSSKASKPPWELPAMNGVMKFPRSDGDPTRRPRKLQSTVAPGVLDYMAPLGPQSDKHKRWRKEIGYKVATWVMDLSPKDAERCHVDAFPAGYELFDKPRQKVNDNGLDHLDAHLYGSKSLKGEQNFRSLPEFIPHAIWLFSDPTLNKDLCDCYYCNRRGRTQTEISQKYGYSKGRPVKGFEEARAASRRARGHQTREFPKYSAFGPILSAESRPDDVARARAQRSRVQVGELVWCAVRPPYTSADDKVHINFWPALVLSVTKPSGSQGRTTTQQVEVCKVSPLGSGSKYDAQVALTDILPYQVYPVSDLLAEQLRKVWTASLSPNDLDDIFGFRPIPIRTARVSETNPPPFRIALLALRLAMRIGTGMANWWSPIEFKPTAVAQPSTESRGRTADDPSHPEGVWCGAELIQRGEAVRLHVQVSQDALKSYQVNLCQNLTPGAGTRCLFLRVDDICRRSSSNSTGSSSPAQTCWLAGPVFETVDKPDGEHTAHRQNKSIRETTPGDQDWPISASPPNGIIASTIGTESGPLPEPPANFEFRPLLADGERLYFDLSCLAGRYYPYVALTALTTDAREGSPRVNERLWSLSGYVPGSICAMPCNDWAEDRKQLFEEIKKTVIGDYEKAAGTEKTGLKRKMDGLVLA